MNRRNFIKVCGSSAVLSNSTVAPPLFAQLQNLPEYSAGSSFRFGDGRDWFFEKRYGMFVHWGLYAIPGWHEQHQYRAKIPRKEYVKLKEQWNPVKFDPEQWLDLLQESGMEYLTVTAKHCDGFCLWDTDQTTFNTVNSPYGKDIIGMLSAACRKRNIPLCLYYSIVDWNNPNYPNQGRSHELQPQPQDTPDLDTYLDFLRAQVKELCTNYGEIHGFWWDANRLGVFDPSINNMIRSLQPKAVINERGFDRGDYDLHEREYNNNDGIHKERPLEACQSVGMQSWGYRENEDFYTNRYLMRSIDKYRANNANYLLNVGPDPAGMIREEYRDILLQIGDWYNSVKESFDQVKPVSDLTDNPEVYLTARDNILYVHLNQDPRGDAVQLKPITAAPRKAILLNTGEEVDFEAVLVPSDHRINKRYLRLINLPTNEMCNTVLIIKLEFDRPLMEIDLFG